MHACLHVDIQTCIFACMDVICICIYTCLPIYKLMNVCLHTNLNAYIDVAYMHTLTYMETGMHTYIHTYINTHINVCNMLIYVPAYTHKSPCIAAYIKAKIVSFLKI